MSNIKTQDDYNWDTYTRDAYEPQLLSFVNKTLDHGTDQIIKSFSKNIETGELEYNDDLHINWKELYNQVSKLKVKNVFEVGCGCAHHLINIHITCPDVEINGCDYSKSQIELGNKYFELDKYNFKNIIVQDMALENSVDKLNQYEFVFTQAVTMHLKDSKARQVIKNMGKCSYKYIFFIENWGAHNYPLLFKECLPNFKIIHDLTDTYKYQNFYLLERI
jgi:2-polyprenyl-3-methyl-5-hydroxy-6-metoxy-1,4-benzoquinol methylase